MSTRKQKLRAKARRRGDRMVVTVSHEERRAAEEAQRQHARKRQVEAAKRAYPPRFLGSW